MKNEILDCFNKTAASGGQKWVAPYAAPTDPSLHQFILFLKPEVTCVNDGADLGGVLDTVFGALDRFDVRVGAVRVLAGPYLKAHRIMDQHYGVINRISKGGKDALSQAASAKLWEVFGEMIEAGAQVLGGHQFLEEHPEFSPLALSVLNDNIGTTKLGGGAYAMKLKVLGRPFILLNPFHAYQLVPYNTDGRGIVVMEGLSSRPWKELRQQLAGATNPQKAEPGSIRNELLQRKTALGLPEVDQGLNGIHLSAGPLEGMVELIRFFADHEKNQPVTIAQTAFGALLGGRGLKTRDIDHLASNPVLERDGRAVTAFDLTEEADAAASASLLAPS